MSRLTKNSNNNHFISKDYITENNDNYTGEAVDKLADFENALEEILIGYNKMGEELKTLRDNGEKKSVKFRELLGNKLIYSMIILILKKHNLIDESDNME